MYFSDVWADFKELVRTDDTDIERKIKACNGGYLYLLNLMFTNSKMPEDLLVVGQGIDINYGYNYATLPTDFYSMENIYLLDTDLVTYNLLNSDNVISFKDLVLRNGSEFNNSSNLGQISKVSFKGTSKIYFDVYNNVYNTLELSTTGSWSAGQTVVEFPPPQLASATVVSWTSGTKKLIISGITDEFDVGTLVINIPPPLIASGTIVSKSLTSGIKLNYYKIPTTLTSTSMTTQLIELGNSYREILALAFACYWLFMEDSVELESKQSALVSMVKSYGKSLNVGARYNSLNI